jgi:hypothetical protein
MSDSDWSPYVISIAIGAGAGAICGLQWFLLKILTRKMKVGGTNSPPFEISEDELNKPPPNPLSGRSSSARSPVST